MPKSTRLTRSGPRHHEGTGCHGYFARSFTQLIDPPPIGAGLVQLISSAERAVMTRLPSVLLRFGIELRSMWSATVLSASVTAKVPKYAIDPCATDLFSSGVVFPKSPDANFGSSAVTLKCKSAVFGKYELAYRVAAQHQRSLGAVGLHHFAPDDNPSANHLLSERRWLGDGVIGIEAEPERRDRNKTEQDTHLYYPPMLHVRAVWQERSQVSSYRRIIAVGAPLNRTNRHAHLAKFCCSLMRHHAYSVLPSRDAAPSRGPEPR
jgi:hypothetical protein